MCKYQQQPDRKQHPFNQFLYSHLGPVPVELLGLDCVLQRARELPQLDEGGRPIAVEDVDQLDITPEIKVFKCSLRDIFMENIESCLSNTINLELCKNSLVRFYE